MQTQFSRQLGCFDFVSHLFGQADIYFILIFTLSLSHVFFISFAPAPLHTVIVFFFIHPNFAGHIGCLLPPYFLPPPTFGLPAPHFRGWLILAHPPPAIWYTPMVFYDEICFENIKIIWLHCRYSRSLSNLPLSSDKHPFCFFMKYQTTKKCTVDPGTFGQHFSAPNLPDMASAQTSNAQRGVLFVLGIP